MIDKEFNHLDCWSDEDNKSICPYCMKEHSVDETPKHEGDEVTVECPDCNRTYLSIGFVQSVSKTSYRIAAEGKTR